MSFCLCQCCDHGASEGWVRREELSAAKAEAALWKETALTIQANTRATCAREERERRGPLVEAVAELELLCERRHLCGDPDSECPLFDCNKPGEAAEIAERAARALKDAP